MNFTFAKMPEGCEGIKLPSLFQEENAIRFAAVESVLGEKTKEYLEKLGDYQLEDSLVHELRLRGIGLSEKGEFPALSPNRWPSAKHPLPAADFSWDQVKGILLDEQKSQEFRRFLDDFPQNLSLEIVCKIVRHYFFEESLVLVVDTRPRVSL